MFNSLTIPYNTPKLVKPLLLHSSMFILRISILSLGNHCKLNVEPIGKQAEVLKEAVNKFDHLRGDP